jgi:stage II sporulation SpoAA-like protein
MSMEMRAEGQRLLAVRIQGILRRSELDEFQRAAAKMIRKAGKVAALVVLDGFQGWERTDKWGDVSFLTEYDTDIEKIAIVGEELWREEVLMFAGAGLRSTPVRYFTDAASARAWLGAAPPPGTVSGPTGASR